MNTIRSYVLVAAGLTAGLDASMVRADAWKTNTRPASSVEMAVAKGRVLFTRIWDTQKPAGDQGDGLGPLFNERSCVGCHKQGGVGGGGPSEKNVQIVNVEDTSRSDPKWSAWELNVLFPQATSRSVVLHKFGLQPQYELWRRRRLSLISQGDREDAFRFRTLMYSSYRAALTPEERASAGSMTLAGLTLEERNTTALYGSGLLDTITLETLEAVAESQPSGVRGRPAILPDGRVGRFGWKAQNVTLLDFNENACAVELGLETPTRHQMKTPEFPRLPHGKPSVYNEPHGLDVTKGDVEALTLFVGALPQPIEQSSEALQPLVARGKELFADTGCAVCHVPQLGSVRGIYSDLLLHRVGGSGSIYYSSSGERIQFVRSSPPLADEFRTPPLWGVADSAPYLHDASAATLEQAILNHQSQAADTTQKYRELDPIQRKELVAFLESLRAPKR